ncbi:MAG: hypothetical protein JNL87_21260 [Burkholderiaceae bacterium]|nr:hypothetical protein [Burkholderiaceae bacterium]
MLHCNMKIPTTPQLILDDLLADLRHARRQGDMGRLALLAYCEVRRWARQVGEFELAEHSAAMLTEQPYQNREAFLRQVDRLIDELEQAQSRLYGSWPAPLPMPPGGAGDPGAGPGSARGVAQRHR